MQGVNNLDGNYILARLNNLDPALQRRMMDMIIALEINKTYWRHPASNFVTDDFLNNFGSRLIMHHAMSKQPLTKDRFEYAIEAAMNESGQHAELENNRTNRGHDITINNQRISLKTEASAAIRYDKIHVSKWMELGRGRWELPLLRDLFIEHMTGYERIFTLRAFKSQEHRIDYELVEIPKNLMLEATNCELSECINSRQDPKPGYGYVRDQLGNAKFSLYFDGGSERKLQIKHLDKSLCFVHATWRLYLRDGDGNS
jgi:hypothetical protein